MKTLILNLDSSVSKTCREQEGSACNGHFGCECYHSLFCFNQFDDPERALLRNGNVASAHDCHFVQITPKWSSRASGAVFLPASRPLVGPDLVRTRADWA